MPEGRPKETYLDPRTRPPLAHRLVRTEWGGIHTPLIDMSKRSAGLLMFRRLDSNLQVFLVHPGGPFWKKKDAGAHGRFLRANTKKVGTC
jgi:hypothetical protein